MNGRTTGDMIQQQYIKFGFPAVAVFFGGAKEGFLEGGKEDGNLR